MARPRMPKERELSFMSNEIEQLGSELVAALSVCE